MPSRWDQDQDRERRDRWDRGHDRDRENESSFGQRGERQEDRSSYRGGRESEYNRGEYTGEPGREYSRRSEGSDYGNRGEWGRGEWGRTEGYNRGESWNRGAEGRYSGDSGREYQNYGRGASGAEGGYYGTQGYTGGRYGSDYANQGRSTTLSSSERDRGGYGQGEWGGRSYNDVGQWRGTWGQEGTRTRYGQDEGMRGYGGATGGYGSYAGGMGAGMYQDQGRYSGKGPKNYQRSDDRIKEDINEQLTRHPEVDATEIDVQVNNCNVTLTGTVDERRAKRLAEDIAEGVSGVKNVTNQIRVESRDAMDRGTSVTSSTTPTTGRNK
jgi:osmotically-inducible protein OsmY